jgi:sigma-B regulation protein RsbU (phosphoserine phosphatase)
MLMVIVVFIIITLIVTYLSSTAVFTESRENARSRMEIANLHINTVLVAVEVAVDNTVPEVESMLSNPDGMYDVVRSLLEYNPNIIGSTVAFEPNYYPSKGEQFSPYAYRDINGEIQTKQLGTANYVYHNMDWYLTPKLQKKSCWSEPYFDTGGGEQMMTTYSHPLYDANGKLYGILTADVSLEWLTDLLTKSDIEFNQKVLNLMVSDENDVQVDSAFLYNHAYTYIIGKSGTYIAHPLRNRILNDTYFTYSAKSNDSADDQIGKEMIAGKAGMRSIDRDGTKFIIHYAPIARTGWSMATVIPYKLIVYSSVHSAIIIMVVMFLGLIVLYAVCRRILKRGTEPLTRFAKSADEIAQGNLNASLPQIRTHDEMKHLHDSFAMMQTSLMEQMEEMKRVNEQKGRIEGELKVASDIQMSMIPKQYPPYPERNDIDIYGCLTPAKEVGGDLYDFYIRDEKLFFCVGDVSGKGVPASLVMAVSRTLFRNISTHVDEPNRIMSQMNEVLADQNDSNMFVTFFAGAFDLKTGRLTYCNGGHDAPLLLNVREKRVETLPCSSNLPLGAMPGWEFEAQETVIAPGTLIFLYTDGLTEAEESGYQLFGESRIFKVAEQMLGEQDVSPTQLIEQMTHAVHDFVGDAEQSDDLTMLAIKWNNQ